jgi:hypothetical protein
MIAKLVKMLTHVETIGDTTNSWGYIGNQWHIYISKYIYIRDALRFNNRNIMGCKVVPQFVS